MLEISHIDVFYGDLQALWDVSMTIDEGKIVTLVGSNGAGKSTLMLSISGLIKHKTGSIRFEGIRLDRLPSYRRVEQGISMVPEGRRLFPQMTVLENLEVGASIKAARKVRLDTLNWICELFPILRERKKQRAGTLSGGEQQMLAIGRVLMSRPRLLLIDEMSLGLSPLLVQEISRVIKDINKSRKLTILLVEQDVQLALSLADWGYIIENGRIVGQGEARELLCSEEVKEAYLGMGLAGKVG
ncbi:MAG: ABC transporter ATP-binding protein [Thermodesulfobacteriota bacterium]